MKISRRSATILLLILGVLLANFISIFSFSNPASANDSKNAILSSLRGELCPKGGMTDTAWATCISGVGAAYDKCSTNDRPGVTGSPATIATCMNAAMASGTTIGNKQATESMVKSAQDAGQKVADDANAEGSEGGDAEGGTSCNVDGLGYFICPIIEFMGFAADHAFGFLAKNLLEVKSDKIVNPQVQNAWGAMRNIANGLFVVFFLIIIYSQMSGVGISSYGIKKMLPRLIIAAVLVNLSYVLCQLAIDLSNGLGYALNKLFTDVLISISDNLDTNTTTTGMNIAAIVIGILATGTGIALFLSVPVLLSAVLALGLIVLILFARIALIIMLVVISPLAFVAYLLPNTEQWFKKWLKLFYSVLIVFPIVAIIFGASSFAAKIISGGPSADSVTMLIALGVATVPLFAVPSVLKGSLNATGAIGAKLSGAAGRAGKMTQSASKAKLQSTRAADAYRGLQRRRQINQANRRTSGLRARFDNTRAGKALGLDRGAARAEATVREDAQKDYANAQNRASQEDYNMDAPAGSSDVEQQAFRDEAQTRFERQFNNATPEMRAAMTARAAEQGSLSMVEYAANSVGRTPPTNLQQRMLNESIAKTANDSGVISSSGADQIRLGGMGENGFRGLVRSNASNIGAQSLASLDNDTIGYMNDVSEGDNRAINNMRRSAYDAMNNETISASIKKNNVRDTLTEMAALHQPPQPAGNPAPQPAAPGNPAPQPAAPGNPAPQPAAPNQTFNPNTQRNPQTPTLRGGESTTSSGLIIPRGRP